MLNSWNLQELSYEVPGTGHVSLRYMPIEP